VRVVQDAQADSQDLRPVPPDQRGKGGFLTLAGEALEQMAVG
jgi:hypothetical protein